MTDKICSECKEDRPSYDYSHGQKMCDFCYESDYHPPLDEKTKQL